MAKGIVYNFDLLVGRSLFILMVLMAVEGQVSDLHEDVIRECQKIYLASC